MLQIILEDSNTSKKYILVVIFVFIVLIAFNVSEVNASEVNYIHTNHQGSVIEVTDSGGNVVEASRYYAYGENRLTADSLQTTDRAYTSQIRDTETDLYYYNARYYDPMLSTFISADPAEDRVNRYQYVAGRPVNSVDPTGNRIVEDPEDDEYTLKDNDIQKQLVESRAEQLRRYYLARHALNTYPNLMYQSQEDVSDWACLPTTWAMLADMRSTQDIRASDVAESWEELGIYDPLGGASLWSVYVYSRDDTEYSPGIYQADDRGLLEVDRRVKDFEQPALVTTTIGHRAGSSGHFSVFLGVDESTGYAMYLDPYLYNTNLDEKEMFVANGVLFVDYERAQNAFQSVNAYYMFLDVPSRVDTNYGNDRVLSDKFGKEPSLIQ